ncbi:PIN domain-like protein [Rhexocercosporidium sp. MPI-PUGE-AT-0058]|nr:PIN domain-like protein [Rhexocercosporidium sp. MPI-PUGE-AT-0058]
MGIPGLYQEIGPGKRVALVKLAIEKYEETGRPLRIAIDTSIWLFQVRAAQGPALQTLYYRLLRLLSVSVQPLFIFDGANKPLMKRNKHTAPGGMSILDIKFKQLLNHFGFPYHTAPGEAEAECALLQREGIADAVLSEDVDTLVFGCGLTLRNWSSESSKGKVPTHVNVYDAQATKQGKSGLDPEGMILVALLSGGDYDTNGVTGFGAKIACEAARAGFGKSLCRISRTDAAGYAKWRERFNCEVQTNESKHFKSKHKSLKLPEIFPKLDILGYYTNPVVSDARGVAKLRDELTWEGEIDIVGLRQFVAEAFGWKYKAGAMKLIRGLAPVLLAHKLRLRGDRRASGYNDPILTAMNEMELVSSICGKRAHFATDALPEIRVIFHPNDIVGLDIEAEEDITRDYRRDSLAPLLEDDEVEAYVANNTTAGSASPSKRVRLAYDPIQPEKVWIAQTIVKAGVPLKVEDYEESLRNPKKLIRQNTKEKQAAAAAKKVASKKPALVVP